MATKQGHQEMVLFLLSQPEIVFSEVKQDGRDKETILETAIRGGHTSIVKELLGRGWNVHYSSGDLAACLMVSIIHNPDAASRIGLVSHLLSLTNDWRSESFTAGILRQLFKKGDIKLAQVVIDTIKSDTSDHSDLLWLWNLPDRYIDDNDDTWALPDEFSFQAVCEHDADFVNFFFTNLQHMPKTTRDSVCPETFVTEVERSINENKLPTFKELLKHATTHKLSKNKALAYTAARGTPDFLVALVQDFDLNSKFPDYGMYWLEHSSGSNLRYVLGDLELGKSPFLFDSEVMTVGSFCLGVAIKALKTENVKFFLERGIQLGIRLSYITGNFLGMHNTRLLVPIDADIGSWVCSVTYQYIGLLSSRRLIAEGAFIYKRGVFLSRGKDGGRLKLRSNKFLKDCKAKAICGIEISYDAYEEDAFEKMGELLKKHHLPWIYTGEYTRCYESSLL